MNFNSQDTSEEMIVTHIDQYRRRLLMGFGTGAMLPLLSQADAAQQSDSPRNAEAPASQAENENIQIHEIFGAPLLTTEVPSDIVDKVVGLYSRQGIHEGFPSMADGPDAGNELDEFEFEFIFDPVGIHVRPDGIIHFDTRSGLHTVTALHSNISEPEFDSSTPTRIPEGVPGFTSPPLWVNTSWLYRFTTKGVYDLMCWPHSWFGMVMRVVVYNPDEDSLDDPVFEEPALLPASDRVEDVWFNARKVLSARELSPTNIVDEGEIAWADLTIS